jgi:4-oxalocrotonate tautomerase
MPEVVVYMLEGRSLEQKRGLIKDITAAIVKNAGTTAEQVTVSLVETAKTAKGKGDGEHGRRVYAPAMPSIFPVNPRG